MQFRARIERGHVDFDAVEEPRQVAREALRVAHVLVDETPALLEAVLRGHGFELRVVAALDEPVHVGECVFVEVDAVRQ